VDNVLDHSRIEAESVAIDRQPVALVDLIAGLIDLHKANANAKGLTLGYRIDGPVPSTLLTDPYRLRQVLTNLISNALKFTHASSVTIGVSAETVQGAEAGPGRRHRVRFRVTDTGIGIPPEQLDRIVIPFTQAAASITRRYGGSGLGLSISQKLAAMLGGRVSVESIPGAGSTFTLEIVAEQAVPDAQT
jgi:signal transduction histidine kinase